MSKRINKVELCYENCEVLKIPIEYILDFQCEGYKKTARRVAMNSISEMESFDNILIEVNNSIEKNKSIIKDSFVFDENINVLDFIKRNDITSITFVYDDLSEKVYYVNWDGNEYEDNNNSTYIVNSSGDVATIITDKTNEQFNEYVDEFKEIFMENGDTQRYKRKLYRL